VSQVVERIMTLFSVQLPPWRPWQAALALAALCFVLLAIARHRLEIAREDYANAYFYSPSQKNRQRQRRQRWQDRVRLLLVCTLVLLALAGGLYLIGPR
jgi:predicted lysophospholipase L1 biosynthesis ABC-type transport system permease subunit